MRQHMFLGTLLLALGAAGCADPDEVYVPPPPPAPAPVLVANDTGEPLWITFDAHLGEDEDPLLLLGPGEAEMLRFHGGQAGFTLLALDAGGEIVSAYLVGDPCGCAWEIR